MCFLLVVISFFKLAQVISMYQRPIFNYATNVGAPFIKLAFCPPTALVNRVSPK